MRSPIRWYGGKGKMTKKLIALVPAGGKPYVEPYAGGASLFFARDPAPVEVLNDVDGDLINFYRVLQDPDSFRELQHRLQWTLYSADEFERAIEMRDQRDITPVMRAWAMFVRQNQGFSGKAETKGNWSRTFVSHRGMANTCSKWVWRIENLKRFHERLRRVQIDSRDAISAIKYWDSPETVFYVDPPYHHETRSHGNNDIYASEPGHDHHVDLVNALLGCAGAVTLSCYYHEVYEPLVAAGWNVVQFETVCYAAGRVRGSNLRGTGAALKHAKRVETVLLNPRAAKAVGVALSQVELL